MLEVLFSDSAAGSMKVGMNYRHKPGKMAGAVGFIFADGQQPDEAELEKLQREHEARKERKWAEAVPFTGDRKDILSFSLALGHGLIDEDPIGKERQAALEMLYSIYPKEVGEAAVADLLQTARTSLDRLLLRAGEGEKIRVWVDDTPDSACGLLWLCAVLTQKDLVGDGVTLVRQPMFTERPDGWGETEPSDWGRMARGGVPVPEAAVQTMAAAWEALRRENGALRGILNGWVVTLPEGVYDGMIERELAGMPGEFMEAQLIGKVLGKHRPGVGDAFLALRVEEMIGRGRLAVLTEADAESPKYHRMLCKINN